MPLVICTKFFFTKTKISCSKFKFKFKKYINANSNLRHDINYFYKLEKANFDVVLFFIIKQPETRKIGLNKGQKISKANYGFLNEQNSLS